MKILGLLLVVLFAIYAYGQQEKNCGAELTRVLWIICGRGFNRLPIGKRTGHSNYMLPSIKSNLPYPYFSNSLSNIFELEQENFEEKNRRIRMLGVVDDCCLKSCSLDELSTYCAR